ncbi:MAG: hypothetical protein VKL42_07025 [Snowella sp.]|nr:hypothetical protein [Snowella sp.]
MMQGVVNHRGEATISLVGMSLLYGYDLYIRTLEGGIVTIKAIE